MLFRLMTFKKVALISFFLIAILGFIPSLFFNHRSYHLNQVWGFDPLNGLPYPESILNLRSLIASIASWLIVIIATFIIFKIVKNPTTRFICYLVVIGLWFVPTILFQIYY